jgi:hypothetical protein
MHIKNVLRHKELNTWKKHEHITNTQGASNKRRNKNNQIKIIVFLRNAHKRKMLKENKTKPTKTNNNNKKFKLQKQTPNKL